MPWTGKQHRLFEAAAHSGKVAKKVGIPQGKAAEMAEEGVMKKPMNPVMHTHHPMEKSVGKGNDYDHERKDEHPGEKGKPFMRGRKEGSLHKLFGPGEGHGSGFEKGGGREHPEGGLKYLKGGSDAPLHASPDHFAEREHHDGKHEAHPDASMAHEGKEFGTEGLRNNLGSKRKSGYGDPQGGTTSLPETPGIKGGTEHDHTMGKKLPEGGPVASRGMKSTEHEDLADETRGTHELPAHEYAAKHDVPQEHKERLAKALMRARR